MAVSPGVLTLCENSDDTFLEAAKLLLTYADNILRYPHEEKHRSISVGNSTFTTKLLPINGAVECLFEMGFEEAETKLVLPRSASLEQVKFIRESLAAEIDQRVRSGQWNQTPPTPESSTSVQGSPSSSSLPTTPSPSQLQSLENTVKFMASIKQQFERQLLHEDPVLQQKARDCIPYQQLSSAAKERLKQAKQADPGFPLAEKDLLVLELLSWFKKDFFSWVNELPCSRCGGKTQSSGYLSPTSDDLRWDAPRVENHYCQTCQLSNRFPRYDHPEKLLETRRGRCGEWAKCFMLCCRALGWEVRFIWDNKDHVWTEVYSASQSRWVHCDPCENAYDKPLLYEVGWGNKLSYVLAFSKDEVVDVTWRYTFNHTEVLSRRTEIPEPWLRQTLTRLNVVRQQSLGPQRKQELTERLLVELVEFISPKKPKPGELGGRTSGALAWRAARGETGAATPGPVTGFVFTPTETERRARLFHLRYTCSKDQYRRVSNSDELITGWEQAVWTKTAIARKVEHDWQMVYISRIEGSSKGRVSWRIDCASQRLKVKDVSIKACGWTLHSGRVCWRVRSGQKVTEFSGDGKLHSFPSLTGCSEVIIEAELSGGDGQSSWQHAQLFRQSLKETEETSFEILIGLDDA